MLTSFGKALRKLRIERQEVMKDMAKALGVSSAYLSAVETGKRRIPNAWVTRISEEYSLDRDQTIALQNAADDSLDAVTISLKGLSPERKDAILSFARACDRISDEDLTTIIKELKSAIFGSDF